MIDKKIEQLMWQEIDGTISPDDGKRLERFMSEHAKAREHYQSLIQFSALLGSVEEIDPGPVLREKIEASIDANRYVPAARPSKRPGLFGFRPRFGQAFAMAAGLLIGVFGYHLVNYGLSGWSTIDPTKIGGTLILNDGTEPQGLRIDLETVQGTIGFYVDGDQATADVRITSQREVRIELEYEGQSMQFGAQGGVDSPLHEILVTRNSIAVTNLGSGRYRAVFQREDSAVSPLSVRITGEGQVLLEERVFPK